MLTENQRLGIILFLYRKRKKREKFRKDYWVHPLNTMRMSLGEHIKLEEMYTYYPNRFLKYTRLLPSQFDFLLNLIKSDITKTDTNYRKAIPPKTRLLVTLR